MLSIRFLRSWYRCPVNLAIQAAQYIFFALLIGARPTPVLAPLCSHAQAAHGRVNSFVQQESLSFGVLQSMMIFPVLQLGRALMRSCMRFLMLTPVLS